MAFYLATVAGSQYFNTMKTAQGIRTQTEEAFSFFSLRKLKYLKRTVVLAEEAKKFNWKESAYYRNNEEEFVSLTERYGSKILQGWMPELYLKYIDDQIGWGVFSGQDLNEGDFVGEYTGYVVDAIDAPPEKKIEGRFLSDFSWNYPDELPDGREFEINAMEAGNEMRYVNHSFSPNCVVDHTLIQGFFVTFFKTLRKVSAGEQILVDYGEEYWSGGFREFTPL